MIEKIENRECIEYLLYLGFAANASIESLERHNLFVLDDVLQELHGASERHSLDGMADLSGILEVSTEIGAARLDRLGRILRLSRVASHLLFIFYDI